MITLGGSGAEKSIHLHSKDLQSFQKDCFFLYRENNVLKFRYTSPDNTMKSVYGDTEIIDTMDCLWKLLTRNFAAIACETGKKLILFYEKDGARIIANCSHDLRVKFQGKPFGCDFDELLKEDNRLSQLWRVRTLDGQPTEESFWLKRTELLATFNHCDFWAYQFSSSKTKGIGNSATEVTHEESPISSVSRVGNKGVIPLKPNDD